ncbi:MAG: hypothetical protein WCK37_01645 [Candidatus Falkowbacteria bacterium]
MTKQIYDIPIPGGLLDRVLNRVHYEIDIMGVKKRIVLFSVITLALAGVFVVALKSLNGQLAVSGFFYFSALLFSDSKVVMSYWQSFSLALIQSLPVFTLLWTLSILFALLKSLQSLLKNAGESLGFYRHAKIN